MANPMVNPRSILIVDDDENLARTLSIILRAHGYRVSTAYSGVAGYEKYLSNPTQVVITDIQMPEMDGLEMMAFIRAINSTVKTVYLSGDLDRFQENVELEGLEFNVVSLQKPISTEVLLEAISGNLGLAQAS
jgi:DNA-binding response OmpR family regulator